MKIFFNSQCIFLYYVNVSFNQNNFRDIRETVSLVKNGKVCVCDFCGPIKRLILTHFMGLCGE